MRPLRKLAFLIEDFSMPSPGQSSGSSAQQLLDRFLLGYPRDGAFRQFPGLEVVVHLMVSSESDFGTRIRDFRLRVAPVREALSIVQGSSPGADLHALEGLLPVLEKRRGGEAGIRRVRFLEGADVWRAGEKGLWSQALLAAAISRSHSPQGDPLVD